MKTAILISGQLRTFAKCWPTQRWHVLRHFEDPHFFITVQQREDNCSIEALRGLIKDVGADRVHLDLRDDPQLWEWIDTDLTNAYHQAPYTNAAPAHQLLLQHWYQNECWKFFKKTVGDTEPFSTVIRMRGDNFFHDFTPPARDAVFFNQCHTPRWGKFGGVNDRFAVMGEEAAAAYFTLWDAIPALIAAGCPFHPESLLKAHLERENVALSKTLHAEFSTLRANNELRHWTREVLPSEMAA